MLAENPARRPIRLLGVTEGELSRLPNLTHTRVVATHGDRVLLIFGRQAHRWRLVGGPLAPNEAPRDCALRQLRFESDGVCASRDLRYVGTFEHDVTPALFGSEPEVQRGALFAVEIEHIAAFLPTPEIGATMWWGGSELTYPFDLVDRHLIALARAEELQLTSSAS